MSLPVLTGRFLSPFVRRVGVTLNHYGIPFERQIISAIEDEAAREATNPVGRVPALVLPSGEILIDSAAILDHLDETADAAAALVPRSGAARRKVLYLLAVATGAIERAMGANAERRRPGPQHDAARQQRLLRQTQQGFAALETELGNHDWFNDQGLGQADITAAVGFSFVNHIFEGTLSSDDLSSIARLAARCEDLPAFKAAQID